MSIAAASPRHVFGFKSNVANNLWYLDEQTIVYPSGSNCILYNIDQRTQKFIPCTENGNGITAIAVSPNRRYVAIAEKSEKPTITIYDLHSLRKRKVLSSPECQSMEYVSIAFSPDSKYLIAQGGRPDWTLLYWTWEKAKVLASTKSTNQQNSLVYQVGLVNNLHFFILFSYYYIYYPGQEGQCHSPVNPIQPGLFGAPHLHQ